MHFRDKLSDLTNSFDSEQSLFTIPYLVVIMHEKSVFFFRNISKTAETILLKKIGRNHGISIYKKALISEHRKNYIFRDNNCFVKLSVSLYFTNFKNYIFRDNNCFVKMPVSLLVSLYVTNFCGRASSKTGVNIKTKFHTSFWSIEIKRWLDFGARRPKIKGRGGLKFKIIIFSN